MGFNLENLGMSFVRIAKVFLDIYNTIKIFDLAVDL
jgi:hypothetical protein